MKNEANNTNRQDVYTGLHCLARLRSLSYDMYAGGHSASVSRSRISTARIVSNE